MVITWNDLKHDEDRRLYSIFHAPVRSVLGIRELLDTYQLSYQFSCRPLWGTKYVIQANGKEYSFEATDELYSENVSIRVANGLCGGWGPVGHRDQLQGIDGWEIIRRLHHVFGHLPRGSMPNDLPHEVKCWFADLMTRKVD